MSVGGQGQGSTSLTAHGLIAEYTKQFRGWTASVNGGPQYLEEGRHLYYSGHISLSTDVDASTTFRFTGSRGITPAIFSTPGGMLSNTVGLSVERKLERDLVLSVSSYYAHNSAVPVEIFKYDSLLTVVRLRYQITRSLYGWIDYDYNNFSIKSGTPPGALQTLAFDRHAVTFAIAAKWK
jgi:hypothetical protein